MGSIKSQSATEVSNREMSGSKAVLEALLAEGVEYIFGYPGGAIMPIYDELYDYKDLLKHIFVGEKQI